MLRMKERERLLVDVRSEQGDDQVKNSCHKTALLNKHKMIPKQNKKMLCFDTNRLCDKAYKKAGFSPWSSLSFYCCKYDTHIVKSK